MSATKLSTFSPIQTGFAKFFSISTSFATAIDDQMLISEQGSDVSIYLTGLVVSGGISAGSISLIPPGTTDTFELDPITVAANGNVVFDFSHAPLKMTTGSSLSITTSGFTATHSVLLNGFIK